MGRPLTKDELIRMAPAVIADRPSPKTSDRYVFMPTMPIVEELAKNGWHAHTAVQGKYRPGLAIDNRFKNTEEMKYGLHMIRFRKDDWEKTLRKKGDEVFEMLLVNAHNGRTSLRLMAGIFVVVCGNGLVVCESTVGNYIGIHITKIKELVDDMLTTWPGMISATSQRIESAKNIKMDGDNSFILASKIKEAVWSPVTGPDPYLLMAHRRPTMDNLWTSFNTVQENVMIGGLAVPNRKRMVKTRGVKSTRRDIEVNKTMWNTFASANDWMLKNKNLKGWKVA